MLNVPRELMEIGWNSRPLSYTDFEVLCNRLAVHVMRRDFRTSGMCFECRGSAFIALSERLRGVRLWLVAWHELAHHLLHAPGLRCYSPMSVSKAEAEAELIALCAVLDENTLIRIVTQGELHDYPRDVLKRRLRIVNRYLC